MLETVSKGLVSAVGPVAVRELVAGVFPLAGRAQEG
jgi:hypothetical protein